MQKNKNHFEIGERRVIWQKTGAENVAQMAQQIDADLKEKKIDLSDAEKTKIAEYKTEEKEIIFWSQKEREKFAKSLLNNDGTKKSAEEIVKLINAEIQNELFETKMDTEAKDYEGDDDENDKEEIDENKTRDIIENAWANATKNLNDTQRAKLSTAVLPLINAADKNSGAKGDEKHEIFKNVKDRTGIGFPMFREDLMITGEEAVKISQFIKIEAHKMEKEPKDATENVTEAKKTSEEWQEQKTSAENVLKENYQTPDWHKKPVTKIHPNVQKNIEEKFKNLQSIEELKKLGINLDLEKMKKSLGIILSTRLGENTIENAINQSATENLAKKIEARQSNIVRWVNERYSNDAPKVLAKTFELKGIAKDDEKAILEYLAFGNVETDMRAAEKYFEANNKLNSNEIVQTDEKIKAEEINKNLEVENNKNNPDDAGEEALGGFQKALKSFSEVFKQASFTAGLGKLWEAVMHLWEAVIDGKAWLGGFIIKNIPHGMEESEICPDFLKKWIEDGRKNLKNKEMKDMSAVSILLKLKPADFHIVEDLKNITVVKLLDAKPNDLNKFVEGKEIDISVAQLATIKGRLVGKSIDTRSGEASLSVYDFLKKKKSEKNYLNPSS